MLSVDTTGDKGQVLGWSWSLSGAGTLLVPAPAAADVPATTAAPETVIASAASRETETAVRSALRSAR